MRIEIEPDDGAVGVHAAAVICDAVRAKPDAVLGLPTGSSPLSTYAELERRVAAGMADFSRAVAYAVDEFAGATATTAGTNSVFFAEHLRVRFRALHCPDSGATDPDAAIRAFAEDIRRGGGIDLCVLGIGVNGHIAFNEPGAGRDSRARVVPLTPASREAHAAAFGSLDRVPLRGMTLGVADLLEARSILVLAQGRHKARIVQAALEGPVSANVPASWLRDHGDVAWLLDAAAAALLRT
ncbi:MAG: glucosamine-6-phosphate deaminase [Chloroflexi bacterium]|nr:glucosamine-6-phosphate deaminase [Chloroflexota bacterium]